MLLIGSTAIKHHYPDFPREPKDIDYAVKDRQQLSLRNKNDLKQELLINPILGELDGIAEPNVIYTLKISHLIGWNINWDKHMFDVQFLKKKGCYINMKLFQELYEMWNTIHGKNKRSDLEMSADDFFNNALQTPHDYYHTILNPTPIYTKILKDGKEVEVCQNKFNNLTFEDKCDLVREEVYVMAFERYKQLDYRVAYSKMLRKFILGHAPIWEALFIIENYITLHKPNINYFKILENGNKTT